jgi:hypothetical protein
VVSQWLCGIDDIQVQQRDYPEPMHLLIRQQSQIGWSQIIYGGLSQQWGILQARYDSGDLHDMAHPSRLKTGAHGQWTVGLITLIWESWMGVWELRNSDLHGHNATARRQTETLEDTRQLQEVYARRHLMEPSVQSLLMESVELHQEKPIHVTKNWLRINSELFKTSIQRAQRLALMGVRSIRTYFGPQTDSQ